MDYTSLPTAQSHVGGVAVAIAGSSSVLGAMKMMPLLIESAARADPVDAVAALEGLLERRSGDPLVGYIAVHGLAEVESTAASRTLVDLLADPDPAMRQHVAWAMSRSRPIPAAIDGLMEVHREGGFSAMMAELALEEWLQATPEIGRGLDVATREKLVRPPNQPTPSSSSPIDGLRIAQVMMQGRVDAGLSAAASGDGGGLTTLQVGLTREMGSHPSVSESHLLTRRIVGESPVFARAGESVGTGGRISRLDFGPPGYLDRDAMWPYRPELERELRKFLVQNGPFDAIHLRFADVGTFAASRVAKELGIPIAFTLAPDPHSVIEAAERTGQLTRENLATWEAEQHLLFRMWLVSSMLDDADRLVLLPRRDQRKQFLDLLDVDIWASDRFVSIAEGIDAASLEQATRSVSRLWAGDRPPPVIQDLADAISALPEPRRRLPLLLTAGRLSTVKGLDRVVAAWAGEPEIHDNFNVVVVGGDLTNPSAEERSVLAAIDREAGTAEGFILLGSRSHQEVALLMAAARRGLPDSIGSHGIYVSGSAKEEFGLAIVEALGSGLAVVAPRVGGPATYIDHEFSGYLADTLDVSDIRRGILWANDVRHSEVRADSARRFVKNGYSLAAMADELVAAYEFDAEEVAAS